MAVVHYIKFQNRGARASSSIDSKAKKKASFRINERAGNGKLGQSPAISKPGVVRASDTVPSN